MKMFATTDTVQSGYPLLMQYLHTREGEGVVAVVLYINGKLLYYERKLQKLAVKCSFLYWFLISRSLFSRLAFVHHH
jgi:hypothetical protein